jgi:diguanylate cyclase (GGDEF)-like protein
VLADRIKMSVETTAFPLVPPGIITVSLGLATYPDNGLTAGELLESADIALYAAKESGKNRVSTAGIESSGSLRRRREPHGRGPTESL